MASKMSGGAMKVRFTKMRPRAAGTARSLSYGRDGQTWRGHKVSGCTQAEVARRHHPAARLELYGDARLVALGAVPKLHYCADQKFAVGPLREHY
jgi:hypothetical protein